MAVVKTAETGTLEVRVEAGLNANGKPVYHSRTFKGLVSTASDSDVYAVGQGLASLQSHTLEGIHRHDSGKLVNQ